MSETLTRFQYIQHKPVNHNVKNINQVGAPLLGSWRALRHQLDKDARTNVRGTRKNGHPVDNFHYSLARIQSI